MHIHPASLEAELQRLAVGEHAVDPGVQRRPPRLDPVEFGYRHLRGGQPGLDIQQPVFRFRATMRIGGKIDQSLHANKLNPERRSGLGAQGTSNAQHLLARNLRERRLPRKPDRRICQLRLPRRREGLAVKHQRSRDIPEHVSRPRSGPELRGSERRHFEFAVQSPDGEAGVRITRNPRHCADPSRANERGDARRQVAPPGCPCHQPGEVGDGTAQRRRQLVRRRVELRGMKDGRIDPDGFAEFAGETHVNATGTVGQGTGDGAQVEPGIAGRQRVRIDPDVPELGVQGDLLLTVVRERDQHPQVGVAERALQERCRRRAAIEPSLPQECAGLARQSCRQGRLAGLGEQISTVHPEILEGRRPGTGRRRRYGELGPGQRQFHDRQAKRRLALLP